MKQPKFKLPLIKCPHCGYEYLPCEIYVPKYLVGKSETVIRDALGKVIYEDYETEPSPIEHFECIGCGNQFVVEATMTFKSTEEEPELDFKNQFVSLLDD